MEFISPKVCPACKTDQVYETDQSEVVITCFVKLKDKEATHKVVAYLECIKGHSCPYEINYP